MTSEPELPPDLDPRQTRRTARPRARYAGHRYQWLRQAHLSTSKPWLAQAMATVETPVTDAEHWHA
jgi:hypothetical protein